MRTNTIVTRFWGIRNWLKVWLISRKQTLNTREAAIYLNTSLKYVYQLTGDYHLPFHRTKKQLLYFKKKEIDHWLMARHGRNFPRSTRKPRARIIRLSNGW
ncbi:MAG TPA: helix-turn-helix domain-containing protein [Prolixibacteraceae bacterium]|nr:helix-turn-helix domain-containing protein [Prolixibacteraceae bacterium]